MQAKAEIRCQYCLDPIPIMPKAGPRSRMRPDDAECVFCREVRGELEADAFMRVVLRPTFRVGAHICQNQIWMIWARRFTNGREIAAQFNEAAE